VLVGCWGTVRAEADVVGTIAFEGADALDQRDVRRELPLRPGEAFTREKLEESVEWLRQKKIFDSVRADVVLLDGTAEVTFRLQPTPFVVEVRVAGASHIDEETLLRRARVREDEALTSERSEAAKRRLVDLYVERGYPQATVELEAVTVRPGKVRVILRITEGEPVRVADVVITGLAGDLEASARRSLPFEPGAVATAGLLDDGRQALVRFVRSRGFYEAEVVASESTDGLRKLLRYELQLGRRFILEVEGNREMPAAELLGLIDLDTRPIVTSGTWQLLAIRMQERYREKGFEFAAVRVSASGDDPRRIRFEVGEGPRVHVRDVRLMGVRAISQSTLLRETSTRRYSRLRVPGSGSGIFRRDVLEEDVEHILGRYRSSGFLQAEVREPQLKFSDDKAWVEITFEVVEGPKTTVGALDVGGAEAALEEPSRGLALQPGAALDPAALERDRRELLRRLAALGFVDALVTSSMDPPIAGDDRQTVTVHQRIEPGERVRIGRILIQQNYYTGDSVVRRALPIAGGQFFDPAKLADAQSAIYRLGLFRSVAVHPLADRGPVRDVGVEVGERPNGEFQYGFGYDTRAGVHNFLQIGHKNVWGSGDSVSLRGDLNLSPSNLGPDEYIVALDGRMPHWLGGPFDLKANATRQQSERSIDEFSIRRTSFGGGFEREFVRGLRGSLTLEFEDSDIFDVAPDAVLTGQDVGRLRTVTLNPIVLYDGRDDAFAPTRGVFESLRLRYGSPALGSQVHFAKLTFQHSQYVPLPAGLTWIYAGRVGFAQVLGGSSEVPIRERFFLGGRASVRGYEENEIGPRGGDGHPTGGDFLVNVSTELRFALFLGLGGAVFVDGGGLYLHDRVISLDDFRASVGPGLRYQTPIGSISLDYGFKIDRRRGESIGQVHFTIGNIF
jgi:outer membrane protein insertion porin family